MFTKIFYFYEICLQKYTSIFTVNIITYGIIEKKRNLLLSYFIIIYIDFW